MEEGRIKNYNGISPFSMHIKYVDVLPDDPRNTHDHHIHAECEIYINLTGDVSFMVENRIYPVKSGSVIITRPCEFHHCIYHSNEPHKHLWILFDGDKNEKMLDMFYNRPLGTNNLIELNENQKNKVTELCLDIIRKDKSGVCEISDFLRILGILENGENETGILTENIPADIASAVEFIGENLGNTFTVSEVAKYAHISVNTLERRFVEVLKFTPSQYIKSRRLARAAELLPSSESVSDVCDKCGFRDYSNFIAIFKKQFGVTPLKYKKMYGTRNLIDVTEEKSENKS